MQIVRRNFNDMIHESREHIGHFQVSYNSDARITLRVDLGMGQDMLVNLNTSETQILIEFLNDVYIKSHLAKVNI